MDQLSSNENETTPDGSPGSTPATPSPGATAPGGPPQPPAWAKSKGNVAKPNIDAWFKFDKPGDAIDGVMAFHGSINRDGRQQRIYILRDSTRKGFHVGVGERAGLVGLRRVPVGSRVWICFLSRRKTGQLIEGEEQTIMDFDVRPEHTVDHDIAAVASSGSSGRSPGGVPPGSDDDIPF